MLKPQGLEELGPSAVTTLPQTELKIAVPGTDVGEEIEKGTKKPKQRFCDHPV